MIKVYTIYIQGVEEPFIFKGEKEYKANVDEIKHTIFDTIPYAIEIKGARLGDKIYSTAFSIKEEYVFDNE